MKFALNTFYWQCKYWLRPKYSYCVITMPSENQDSNCYDEFLVRKSFCTGFGPDGDIFENCLCIVDEYDAALQYERAKLPVFYVGEIFIVSKSAREIGGRERKPSKWDIGYEIFMTRRAAIKRSLEVRKEQYGY